MEVFIFKVDCFIFCPPCEPMLGAIEAGRVGYNSRRVEVKPPLDI